MTNSDNIIYSKKGRPMNLVNSVDGRDVETELTLLDELYDRWYKLYIDRLDKLKDVKDFVLDSTYHKKKDLYHIVYKFKCGNNGETYITSNDGNRRYEFLVEFSKEHAAYGIYYGCRVSILKGKQRDEIQKITKEWEEIKQEVRAVLNNTFVNINFLEERFQPDNNSNNKTFWPFYITLSPEEDIVEVGALAVRLIYRVYKAFFNSGIHGKYDTKLKKVNTNITRYTEKAYHKVLESILNNKDKVKRNVARTLFEKFLNEAVSIGLLEIDDRYEKCWRVKELSNDQFSFVIAEFCSRSYLIKDDGSIPWGLFTPIILTKDCGPLDHLKKAYARYYVKNSKEANNSREYEIKAESIVNKMNL